MITFILVHIFYMFSLNNRGLDLNKITGSQHLKRSSHTRGPARDIHKKKKNEK